MYSLDRMAFMTFFKCYLSFFIKCCEGGKGVIYVSSLGRSSPWDKSTCRTGNSCRRTCLRSNKGCSSKAFHTLQVNCYMLGTCTWFTHTFALIGTCKIEEFKLQCVSIKKMEYILGFFLIQHISGHMYLHVCYTVYL